MSQPEQPMSASLVKDAVYRTGLRSFMDDRDLGAGIYPSAVHRTVVVATQAVTAARAF